MFQQIDCFNSHKCWYNILLLYLWFFFLSNWHPLTSMQTPSFRNSIESAMNTTSKSPNWTRKEIIMKNIERALFPLLFLMCVCGLCVFEYPKGRPRLYLTILYALGSYVLYIYFVLKANVFVPKFAIKLPPLMCFFIAAPSVFHVFSIYYCKVKYI